MSLVVLGYEPRLEDLTTWTYLMVRWVPRHVAKKAAAYLSWLGVEAELRLSPALAEEVARDLGLAATTRQGVWAPRPNEAALVAKRLESGNLEYLLVLPLPICGTDDPIARGFRRAGVPVPCISPRL